MRVQKYSTAISFLILAFGLSCGSPEPQVEEDPVEFTVRIHAKSDAQVLNPYRYIGEYGHYKQFMFQSLVNIEYNKLELVPVLAKANAEVVHTEDGKLHLTYEIREEARWDNGNPILAEDVAFTFKVIFCPMVDNARYKQFFSFISDFIKYEDNPRKFTLVSNEIDLLAEPSIGDIAIIPSYVYDPEGALTNLTLKEIKENAETLETDSSIINFANNINSEKYQREKDYVVGSGPYQLESWETGQRIIFKRKTDWWGDQFEGENCYFEAYPTKLVFETISDFSTAVIALKAGKLDVMRNIPQKDFLDMNNSEKVKADYNLHTPVSLNNYHLRLNMRNPKLSDKRVRKALAHILDYDKIIETILYGYGERLIGPFHPTKTMEYHTGLTPYAFDPEKAGQLLSDAGWDDTNGNGVRDKIIDDELVELELSYLLNQDIPRKQLGLILQAEAKKIGIEITLLEQEWSVYLQKLKARDFEIIAAGTGGGAPIFPSNPRQHWHTESYSAGSNYSGFGNASTDSLIEAIRVTFNAEERKPMYWSLQEIIHEEVPYIFLYVKKGSIAIHNKYTNASSSIIIPGFWEPGFKMKEESLVN